MAETELLIDDLQISKVHLKEQKYVFVVNPISGAGKKEEFMEYLTATCGSNEINYEIMPTTKSGNYDILKGKIQEEGITDVIIIGGDGTVNQVIGGLRGLPVTFGIIPFGSGNGLALAANIPHNAKKALDLIVENKGKRTPIDAFSVNGHFACMLSGLGFDADVAHDFSQKDKRGLISYTQQSILNFFKAQPYQFEITVDDFKFFTEAFFISIANSNQFGNNFTIAPEARLNDGLLDIVIVQKMNKMKLPFAILKQISGNNKLQTLVEDLSEKNVIYFQTSSLHINNLKLAQMHIDGEPVETSETLDVNMLPDAFYLYCGS